MKHPALFALLTSTVCLTGAPIFAADVIEPTAAPSLAKGKELLTPAQIDKLLAPVALYPDPLLAIILPASTFPADIVLAARYVRSGGDASRFDAQTWDDSVKALARYPEVLKWMDENLEWTQQVGTAFLLQPVEMLTGTQRLRASAIAAGNLKDSPQQTVIVEREVVRIVPAQREVIYVPVYDPVLVYHAPVTTVAYHKPGLTISFSVGYPAGFWLSYYCNWGTSTVVIVDRPYRTVVWNRYPAWSCPPPAVVHCEPWRPSVVRMQTARRDYDRHDDHKRISATAPTRFAGNTVSPFVAPVARTPEEPRTANRGWTRDAQPRTEIKAPAVAGVHRTPAPAVRPAPEVSVSAKPEKDRRYERVASQPQGRSNDPATARMDRTPSAAPTQAQSSPPPVSSRRETTRSIADDETQSSGYGSPWSRRDHGDSPFGPRS